MASNLDYADLSKKIIAEFGCNAGYVLALLADFQNEPAKLTSEWQAYFQHLSANGTNGHKATVVATPPATSIVASPLISNPTAAIAPTPTTPAAKELVVVKGSARKLVENMEASLGVPTATSQRQLSLKLLDENRRLINEYLTAKGASKISYTHVIAWALVKALVKYPRLNDGFALVDGQPNRIIRNDINIGVAVDTTKADGSRTLLVPNIKQANKLNFASFCEAYNQAVSGARKGNLPVAGYQDTTITLTNPGTIGTTASNPRLMAGQGVIIATGSIDYPPGFQGMSEETLSLLGISKVCTISSTYDHRIIQGAESGSLLAEVDRLLRGEESFYEQIFRELGITYTPIKWTTDQNPSILNSLGAGHADADIEKQARVLEMINAYRTRGHLAAHIDPLATKVPKLSEPPLENFGFTLWDLDREFLTYGITNSKRATLRKILEKLRTIYCSKVGYEYMHIQDRAEREWLRTRIEVEQTLPPPEIRKQMLTDLIAGELFEKFLHTKYLGQKRFSVEGGETSIAMMEQIVQGAGVRGVTDITIGMPHRGRLTLIAHVIGDFAERICTIFEGTAHPKFASDQGDVKYHLGATASRTINSGQNIQITLAYNPSHLEFVNPVVEGIVRAKQDVLEGGEQQVLPIIQHGDAAFAGEGIVPETLNMSLLAGYRTGGTIHIIVNNQIGFTTLPENSRSSTYSSDIALMIQAPIFHINGDDPDAAYNALQIVLDYRQKFHKDIVIDLICFRRHGHNEGDEPSYTQPLMYQNIRQHPGVRTLYGDLLVKAGLISPTEIEAIAKFYTEKYEQAQAGAKAILAQQKAENRQLRTPVIDEHSIVMERLATGVDQATLTTIGQALTQLPPTFNLHPKLKSLISQRAAMGTGEKPVDWGFAEELAFGSLLLEGMPVRLTGQDCNRGTFSQRHALFHDYETGATWLPLNHIAKDQAPCEIYDSLLSEAGVLGFEYGYSVAAPDTLVMWEAQFGDFTNTAQVIVDQFVVSGEEKWNQKSRLVMLLPHGYEGQGPEHSSARIERFLQLCANYSFQVCQCTTPAQYFHLLRRQMHQSVSKPLILFTPKSILRMPVASSTLAELVEGTFHPVLPDPNYNPQATQAIFCSGKVYYDILQARKSPNTQIIRLEQFYPFPYSDLKQVISQLPQVTDWVWAQEEAQNSAGWTFVAPRLTSLLPSNAKLRYAGRAAGASPATGSATVHQNEQLEVARQALAI